MNRIQELQDKILKAKDAYYNTDTPILTDKVFDAYVDELTKLDPNNPAITTVGADLRPSVWLKAKHQIPMGSLDKVNTPDQMTKWINDTAKSEKLMVTDKLDGLSINCVYKDGNLVQAITRGSQGLEGEDIFVNVKQMSGVKLHIKDFTGSLRGEIIMLKSNHKTYFSDKANPRNAASGTCKRFDGLNVDKLNVKFYQVLGNVEFKTEADMFKWLKKNKIDTPNYQLVDSVDKVNELWQTYQDSTRATLDYDIDGLVISINDLEIQNSLGQIHLKSKGKRAFKFDNETAESTLLSVDWQVGNSGRITPVAYVDPVEVGGVMIKKASLHNVTRIIELDLYEGCKVLVSRRNDVIPYIEEKVF